MKWFTDLKIGTRLMISFLIVAIIAGIVGVVGIINIGSISNQSNVLYTSTALGLEYIGEASTYYQRIRFNAIKMIVSENASDDADCAQKVTDYTAQAEDYLNKYEQTITDEGERSTFNDLKSQFGQYKYLIGNAVSFAMGNNDTQARSIILGDAATVGNSIQSDFDQMFASAVSTGKAENDQNIQLGNSTVMVMIAIVAAGVVAAVVLGVLISRGISKPMRKMVFAADRLAAGNTDISIDINSKDETGTLAKAMGSVVASVGSLITDTNMLVDAAKEGRLTARANAFKHEGDYRKIVEGINGMLDAVMSPLNAAAGMLQDIADGAHMDALNPELYNGDFKVLVGNLNLVRESLYLLLDDSLMLVQAAVEGRLSTRADAARHKGGYRDIIEGVNKTLDAVIKPVNEAAGVLSEVSKGNLDVSVTGEYLGDHAAIKNALNDTVFSLKGYIDEISAVLSETAKGDMTQEIQSEYKGAFISLKDSINTIIGSMNNMLLEIQRSADQVATGTSQVSNGSQTLAQGTGEQASSIEELTSSIIEVSAQTQQNAANASAANELALVAKNSASRGNEQMRDMLRSMDEINESSSNISRIIKVIDDIAFQTNILALNAAVEAARAGIHGKGFAVVAEEVRSLAAKSADAANETTIMIEGSIKKVEQGTKLANETAAALSEIVGNVDKASVLVGDIAVASKQQATSISQINAGLEQVSSVVQSNSATAEESAAASEELSGQAELLKTLAAQFKLRDSGPKDGHKSLDVQYSEGKNTAANGADHRCSGKY